MWLKEWLLSGVWGTGWEEAGGRGRRARHRGLRGGRRAGMGLGGKGGELQRDLAKQGKEALWPRVLSWEPGDRAIMTPSSAGCTPLPAATSQP